MKFYKHTLGRILINRIDVSDVNEGCLKINYVLHEVYLPLGVIINNTRVKNSEALYKEIIEELSYGYKIGVG